MNTSINEELTRLQQQLDELCLSLDVAREDRNDLLRQRFDLKEQRRYFRRQLREAVDGSNTERADQLEERLDQIADQLDALDDRIESIENNIDSIEDDITDLRDDMADMQEQLENKDEDNPADAAFSFRLDSMESAMDSLNKGLQKVLGKVADTLEHVDLDNLGQNVHSAASKAAKTVSGVAQDAAKEMEHAYKDIKNTCTKPGGVGDYRISGSGTLDGGCYNNIVSSGACKVSGSIVCRTLKSSGSFRVCGSIDCTGEVRTSGALVCDGDLSAGSFTGSGSTKIAGDMKTGMLNNPGALNVGGSISASEMRVSGSLKTGGDCEAEGFTASGSLNVGGIINADVVNITLSGAESSVGSIGGSMVTVTRTPAAGFLSSLLTKANLGTLSCESIEGDVLDLTGVQAQTVRGTKVTIRSGCVIDRVEYSESCSIDTDASVGACTKV